MAAFFESFLPILVLVTKNTNAKPVGLYLELFTGQDLFDNLYSIGTDLHCFPDKIRSAP